MKSRNFIIFTLLFLLLLPIFVSAQSSNSADGLLGGVDSQILKTVINILNYPVPIVYQYITNSDASMSSKGETAPLWLLFAVFAIVYSIIWIASGFVKIFKDDANRTARIIFSIAVSLITVFLTPVLLWILKLITLFATLAYIALLVLGVFVIWVLFRAGWASGAATNAESSQALAQATQLSAEAGRQKYQAKEFERKTNIAKRNGVKRQKGLISGLRKDLVTVLRDLQNVRRGNHHTMFGKNREQRVLTDLSKISRDLGGILSFKTENDRIMSGMRNNRYTPMDNAGLPGKTHGKEILDAEHNLSTETNDLGRIISGISQEIKTNGIRHNHPPDNIDKLISMTENAVNVATRMERDLVMEEQLVEQI
jgi:hypothetical protein